jgi:hypothetical protein
VARPNWNYIRIDVELPDHEKTDDLSDKAFRTLIEMWCWCGQKLNDGFIRDAKWKTFGTEAARAQLLRVPPGFEHGFAERVPGGYQMHDYTGPDGHQRSRADVDEKRAQRAEAGRRSAAARAAARASPLRLVEQNGNDPLNESLNGSLNKSPTEAEAEAEKYLRHDRCKQRSRVLEGSPGPKRGP